MKKMDIKLQSAPLHELQACETAINEWANNRIADGYEIQPLSFCEVQSQLVVIAVAIPATTHPDTRCAHRQEPLQLYRPCVPAPPGEAAPLVTGPAAPHPLENHPAQPEPKDDTCDEITFEAPPHPSSAEETNTSPQGQLPLTTPERDEPTAAYPLPADLQAPLDTALLPSGIDEDGEPRQLPATMLPTSSKPTIGTVGAPKPNQVATARPAATAPPMRTPTPDDGTGTAWTQSNRTGVWWRHYDHAGTGQVGERKSSPGYWWRIIGPGGSKTASGNCATPHEGRHNCDSFMNSLAAA